jgi:hypothetical protein
MDPQGIWGPVHFLDVASEAEEETVARGRAFELTHHTPSVPSDHHMRSEPDRWTVRTDLRFKPRASKDPPELRWKVEDLWKLRLDMSISKDFEFELCIERAVSKAAVRPVMLKPYEQDLYPYDIQEASEFNKSRAVPAGKLGRTADLLIR